MREVCVTEGGAAEGVGCAAKPGLTVWAEVADLVGWKSEIGSEDMAGR